MNIRLYPLHCYSDSGNLKPPKLFYLVLLFLGRTWAILIISALLGDSGNQLLALFYPDKTHFYLGLALGCIALILLLVSGRDHDKHRCLSILWQSSYPLILLSAVSDLAVQLYYLLGRNFQYSFAASVQLVFIIWILLYCLRSKHLRDCFRHGN
jgi:hypothetical protein